MDAKYSLQIERLYLSMYNRLMVYSRCAFQNNGLSEEAVQETFRIACMKPEELCSSPNPEGWLVLTLKNVIANIKRNRANASQILSDYISSQAMERAISEDQIELAIMYEDVAELEEFHLIREMVLDGKSHLEMAQERGISVSACKKRVQRAKEVLRKKICI